MVAIERLLHPLLSGILDQILGHFRTAFVANESHQVEVWRVFLNVPATGTFHLITRVPLVELPLTGHLFRLGQRFSISEVFFGSDSNEVECYFCPYFARQPMLTFFGRDALVQP